MRVHYTVAGDAAWCRARGRCSAPWVLGPEGGRRPKRMLLHLALAPFPWGPCCRQGFAGGGSRVRHPLNQLFSCLFCAPWIRVCVSAPVKSARAGGVRIDQAFRSNASHSRVTRVRHCIQRADAHWTPIVCGYTTSTSCSCEWPPQLCSQPLPGGKSPLAASRASRIGRRRVQQ